MSQDKEGQGKCLLQKQQSTLHAWENINYTSITRGPIIQAS